MKSRNQESRIKEQEEDRIERLLRIAVSPIGERPELERDLWPAMLRRLDEQASGGLVSVPWFDWALGGALLAFAAVAPRTIPVILYYL